MRLKHVALLLSIITIFTLTPAQSVSSLRQSSWDLPKTQEDIFVMNKVFDATDAVQTQCPQTTIESLTEENALAACATASGFTTRLSSLRSYIEIRLDRHGSWLTPWQENEDFGSVRQYVYNGTTFYIALKVVDRKSVIYLIRFN